MNLKKLGFVAAGTLMLFAVGATMTACGGAPGKMKAETIVYDGETISWGEVKNAEKYLVTINDVPHVTTKTSYALSEKKAGDELVVSVCGLNAKEKEGKKATRTFTRLETISESTITFDEMGVMSWGDIDGADSYLLYIKENGGKTEEVTVSSSTYNEFPTGKQLTIKVRPYTTDGLTFSAWSKSYTKTYLSQVENIKYDGETLTWNGVTFATKYEVWVNGEMQELSGRALEYDAKQTTFNVQVLAKSSDPNVYNSVMTDQKEFIFLPVIEDLTVADGLLTWPEVAAAESYDIRINNGTVQNVSDPFLKLDAGRSLSVEVKPVTSGEVYFSDWSVAKSAYVLEAPELQWNNSFKMEDGEEARAIHWNQVNGSVNGYMVTIEGPDGSKASESYGANQRDILHAFATAGKYTITVQATTETTDVYASAPSAPIIVERLAAPSLKKQNPIVSDPTNNQEFRVTWNAVSFASGYQVFKNGTVVSGVDSANYSTVITNPIPSEATAATTQVYMVQTRGAGLEQMGDGVQRVRLSSIIPTVEGNNFDTCSFEIKSMPTPTALNCAGQWMTWEGSAQKYAVRGIGSDKPFHTSEMQFDLYTLNAGRFYPSVCAQGDGGAVLASNYTTDITVERLAYPENIRVSSYKADLPCISWDSVAHATSYNMTVNASEQVQDVNSGASIAKEWIGTSGVSLGLTATCNEWEDNVYWVTSKESPVKSFLKINTPVFNAQVVRDGMLVWTAPGNANAVNNAFRYELYDGMGDRVKSGLTTPSISLAELGLPAGQHVFTVKCIGDPSCINSDMSNEAKFRILETPTLTHGETAYKWNPVGYARIYEVLVNGEVVKTVDHVAEPKDPDTYYSYTPDKFVAIDVEYTVAIRAVGDDGYSTVNSEYHSIKQLTARLASPSFKLSYTVDGVESDTYSPNGYIVSTITTPNDKAKGYEFKIAGASSGEIKDLTCQKLSTDPGEFEATVCAIGGKFVWDETRQRYVYWATSDYAKVQEFVLHAEVENVIKSKEGHSIEWEPNSGSPSAGYTIYIYCEGVDEPISDYVHQRNTSYDIKDIYDKVYKVIIVVNAVKSETKFEVGSKKVVEF